MKKIATIIAAMLVMVSVADAQTKFKQSPESSIAVNGTSNVHDWTMNATNPTCEATFVLNENGDITSIQALSFSMQVKSLKSDKSGLDKNAYNTLNADKFDKITYTMLSAAPVKVNGNQYTITTTGNMVVAGATFKTDLVTTCVKNTNGTFTCTGTKPVKMTDFKIEPPTFMFGAMKTGDEVSIDYTINLKK
ncbi:MAG TPA: YceI family protein [Cyclobacteriaceae bacterium]|nr:YceI family protein [Cyclobacteriaceae bacterium]